MCSNGSLAVRRCEPEATRLSWCRAKRCLGSDNPLHSMNHGSSMLLHAYKGGHPQNVLDIVLQRSCRTIEPSQVTPSTFFRMRETRCPGLPVRRKKWLLNFHPGRLAGLNQPHWRSSTRERRPRGHNRCEPPYSADIVSQLTDFFCFTQLSCLLRCLSTRVHFE